MPQLTDADIAKFDSNQSKVSTIQNNPKSLTDADIAKFDNPPSENNFNSQMTKGIYQTVPFGKRIVKDIDPEGAKYVENVPEPQTWDQHLGRFVGTGLGMAPLFNAGAGVVSKMLAPAVEGAGNLAKTALTTQDAGTIAKSAQGAQQAAKFAGTAELAGGSVGAGVNVAGEASSEGDNAQEALTKGAEAAAGTMIGGKAIEAAGNAFAHFPEGARDVAGRIHDMIVRLPIKAFQYGKDPLEVMQKEGIIANSTAEYSQLAKERLNLRSSELEQAVQDNKSILDVKPSVDHRIDSAINNADNSLTDRTDLIDRLNDMRTRINDKYGDLGKMSVSDAVKLKRQIADDFPFSPMESPSSTNNLMAKAAHQIYHDINNTIEGVAPKISELNQRVSSLIDISKAAQNRMAVESRNNPIGLIGTIIGGATGTHIAGLAGGAEGAAAGFGTAVLAKAAASPAVLTRVARALSQMAEVDKINLYKAAPWFMELAQKAHDFVGRKGDPLITNLKGMDAVETGKLFGQPEVVKRPDTSFVKSSQGNWPSYKEPVKASNQDVEDNLNTYGQGTELEKAPAKSDWPSDTKQPVNRIAGKVAVTGATAVGATALAENADAAVKSKQKLNPEEDSKRFKLSPQNYTKTEEGFGKHNDGKVYKDTKGHNSVGYGFNVDDPDIRKMVPKDVLSGDRDITKPESDIIFNKLYVKAQNDAVRFTGNKTWNTLNQKQKQALTDMSYNLGLSKLDGFHDLKKALVAGNWKNAGKEVLRSDYNTELPNRARRNSALMDGSWTNKL